ncbi:glycosyltransferase [Pseudooceanicola nitratireducens]|uniref:glycosyltransferase n=1 Tax=Pseudooceanicola nitratireducens TaxID=517719 RepID=UPI003C7DE74B
MLKIAHLIDDTTAGGVTRYLDFLRQDPRLGRQADHQVIEVKRNRPGGVPADADIIVSHLAVSWAGLPGMIALRARHAGTPMVHVEHSYSEGFAALNVTSRARFQCLLRSTYSLFDRVVAVSDAQAGWLARSGLARVDTLDVIPPMVDLTALEDIAAPEGPVRQIAAIGRLDRQKGFDMLIRAFRLVEDPDLTLTFFGDGDARDDLLALAEGDSRIRFAGFAVNPAAAYAGSDLVVMPSRWEPYGLVAAEANVAGRRVLMSCVDGLQDQAPRGNPIVGEPTVAAWADALTRIAGRPAALAQRPTAASLRNETIAGWERLLDVLTGQPAEATAQTA